MKEKCEICKRDYNKAFIDKHHIQSKCYGGRNYKSNIAILCKQCHQLTHKGKIIIEGRFTSSNGYILVWRLFDKPSITGVKDPKVYIMK